MWTIWDLIITVFCFGFQVISDDATTLKEDSEMLRAVTASKHGASISSMISTIVSQFENLVSTIGSRIKLLENSVKVHELYIDEYRRCQEMIAGASQQLQLMRDGSREDAVAVRQALDQLKVIECLFLL